MSAGFTASGAERVAACPASAALPQARTTSEDSIHGTLIHAVLAACIERGPDAALAEAPPSARAFVEALDLSRLPLDGRSYAAEVAIVLDLESGTAREVGRNIGRAYPALGENEVAMSIDVLGLSPSIVLVGDWKTGRGDVTPAAQNWQIRTCSVGASRCYGRDRVTAEIIRLRDDGTIWRDRAEFDAWALDEALDELRQIASRVRSAREQVAAGERPEVHAGEWCRYCPAYVYCPAQTALIRSLSDGDGDWRISITPQNAASAYRRWQQAKELMARVSAALHAYATNEAPIDLGNGELFGPVESTREVVSGTVARDVLRRLHGDAVAEAAVELSTTKTAIREALRAVAQRGQLAGLERDVLAEIASAGGVEVKRSVSCKEHKL